MNTIDAVKALFAEASNNGFRTLLKITAPEFLLEDEVFPSSLRGPAALVEFFTRLKNVWPEVGFDAKVTDRPDGAILAEWNARSASGELFFEMENGRAVRARSKWSRRPPLDHGPADQLSPEARVESRGPGLPLVFFSPLLMPAWLTLGSMIRPLKPSRSIVSLSALAVEHGFRDLPMPPGYSIEMEADAVERALCDKALQGPFDLLAWSAGGAIALEFALRDPARVRSLTLIEPLVLWALEEKVLASEEFGDYVAKVRAECSGAITDQNLERFLHNVRLVPENCNLQNVESFPLLKLFKGTLRSRLACLEYKRAPSDLASLSCPVLLVNGTNTLPLYLKIVDALERRIPGAVRTELPGSHAAALERVGEFLKRFESFQRTCEAGRGR